MFFTFKYFTVKRLIIIHPVSSSKTLEPRSKWTEYPEHYKACYYNSLTNKLLIMITFKHSFLKVQHDFHLSNGVIVKVIIRAWHRVIWSSEHHFNGLSQKQNINSAYYLEAENQKNKPIIMLDYRPYDWLVLFLLPTLII